MNRFTYPRKKVDAAIEFLKKKKGVPPAFIDKFPGQYSIRKGKLYAGGLRVIPTEDRKEFLREIVYGKKSEYPFGRDSLFSILKDEVMNVSKRDIEAFLNEQKPLIHRRSRPPKQKREQLRQIRKPGQLSVDLAYIRREDFVKELGPEGDEYMGGQGEYHYFLNAVDLQTGYLISTVSSGATAAEIAPKLAKLIDEYEAKLGQKVTKAEVDKGAEFMAETKEMLVARNIKVVQKVTNAAIEGVNAKMQRLFWSLVAQKRGTFKETAKLAVKISNRTLNRRIGMTPEEALKKIANKEKVARKTPQAGPTERKKALTKGTKVRVLHNQFKRNKGDPAGYKAYKGLHFGRVLPILNVRYVGVHPKYQIVKRVMTDPVEWEKKSDGTFRLTKGGKKIHKVKVPAVWVWEDQLIKARPEDTKAHNLVVNRPVPQEARAQRPAPPRPAPRRAAAPKPAAPKLRPLSPKRKKRKLYVNQDVVTKIEGRNVYAQITDMRKNEVEVDYYWPGPKDVGYYHDTVDRRTVKPLPEYEVEEKVFVKDARKWHRGEIEDYRRKDNTYLVFWRENNKPWKKYVRQREMRKIK